MSDRLDYYVLKNKRLYDEIERCELEYLEQFLEPLESLDKVLSVHSHYFWSPFFIFLGAGVSDITGFYQQIDEKCFKIVFSPQFNRNSVSNFASKSAYMRYCRKLIQDLDLSIKKPEEIPNAKSYWLGSSKNREFLRKVVGSTDESVKMIAQEICAINDHYLQTEKAPTFANIAALMFSICGFGKHILTTNWDTFNEEAARQLKNCYNLQWKVTDKPEGVSDPYCDLTIIKPHGIVFPHEFAEMTENPSAVRFLFYLELVKTEDKQKMEILLKEVKNLLGQRYQSHPLLIVGWSGFYDHHILETLLAVPATTTWIIIINPGSFDKEMHRLVGEVLPTTGGIGLLYVLMRAVNENYPATYSQFKTALAYDILHNHKNKFRTELKISKECVERQIRDTKSKIKEEDSKKNAGRRNKKGLLKKLKDYEHIKRILEELVSVLQESENG